MQVLVAIKTPVIELRIGDTFNDIRVDKLDYSMTNSRCHIYSVHGDKSDEIGIIYTKEAVLSYIKQ